VLYLPPKKKLYPPKQISGYAPVRREPGPGAVYSRNGCDSGLATGTLLVDVINVRQKKRLKRVLILKIKKNVCKRDNKCYLLFYLLLMQSLLTKSLTSTK